MPKPAPTCPECGNGFEQRKGGRPAKFCSDACRLKAHRNKPATPAASIVPLAPVEPKPSPQTHLEYLIEIRDWIRQLLDDAPPVKAAPLVRELRGVLKEIEELSAQKEEAIAKQAPKPRKRVFGGLTAI